MNIFAGHNGAGKTNLLEAIAYMSLGRSPRTTRDPDLVSEGSASFHIRLQHREVTDSGSTQAASVLEAEYRHTGRRSLRVDGRPIAAAQLYGRLTTVFFSPDDLWLLKGAPATRRMLLDRLLVQAEPVYAHAYRHYREALLQRNAALRATRARRADRALVAIWEPQLIEYGGQILRRRAAVITSLDAFASRAYRDLAGGGEPLAYAYVPAVGPDPVPSREQDWEARLEEGLQRKREQDIAVGATSIGPHRDDLDAQISGRSARHFASQGQQRSAVLALKFAERKHLEVSAGRTPLLLVDDVLSELDPRRRSALQSLLAEEGQVFLTTADEGQVSHLPAAARFEVRSGEVDRLH